MLLCLELIILKINSEMGFPGKYEKSCMKRKTYASRNYDAARRIDWNSTDVDTET